MTKLSFVVRFVLAAAIALAVAVPASTVSADPPGIVSTLLLDGTTYQGTPVVNENATLTLRVQYNRSVTPGSTVAFVVGPNATLTGVPAANTAIASVAQAGNTVSITFLDPWPDDVDQGVFDLRLTVNSVDASVLVPISWTVAGDENSIDVIVKNTGDEFANVRDNQAKDVNPTNLNSFVTVVDGRVTLRPEITAQELTYTLRLDSPAARTGFAISDQLPAGLGYVPVSFAGQLTTWDAAGLNRATNPFAFAPTVASNSFSGSVDVPGPSILAITYKATVTDVPALEAALQAQYDALNGGTGNFTITLTNTANFGGTERARSVTLRGTVAGVNIGAAFAKSSDWSTKNVIANEEGNLAVPADISYTLRADLRAWNGSGPNFTLDRNVVISDVLPSQASWNTADADFITPTGISLSVAGSCPDAATFAGDAFVGQYCVDGQRLLINVGKNNTTNATIAVKAQLNTVTGLTQTGSTTIEDAVPYRWRNTADFAYRSGNPYTATRDVTVVVLPDATGGINDAAVFTKTGAAVDATIAPGDSVTVNYDFKLAAGKGIDVRTSRIVDYVDSDIFDVSDPAAIAISGTYDGQALAAADFVTTSDADGNLVIELSASGESIVDARGADKAYNVRISLTSKPFVGKETKTISNRAILFGEGGEPLYRSETSTEATSFGDEAEIRKRVFDGETAGWAESVTAPMDGPDLVEDAYVYRIEFIPRGAFNNVAIIQVTDFLPDAVSFLGFVSESDAATGAPVVPGPVDIGGNLVATYDATARSVSITQKPGTVLQAGSPIAAFFAVEVIDASEPIVNRIGFTTATIVPLKSVSVGDYLWVDTDRDGRQGDVADEPGLGGVVLTLVGPDGESVTDVFGVPVGPVTTGANGEYTFDGLPALTGDGVYTVRIDQDASAAVLAPYVPTRVGEGDRGGDSSTGEASTVPGELQANADRDPSLDFGFVVKSVSVGDYVWVDTDRDGRQEDGEPGLGGVVLTLVGPDGESVTDVFGVPVGPVTTNADGGYTFDGLPALTGDGVYTVRIDQDASAAVLAPYVPTRVGEGDRGGDSSTGEASTVPGELQVNADRDPSLDFGFVLKTYAIGDYVWIDANNNGMQDAGEKPLAGVKVELLDTDRKVLSTTETDANGRYVFDGLTAGTYQVRFTLTDEQQKLYEFTTRDAGAVDATDSDANPADGFTITVILNDSNGALTGEYDFRTISASQGIDPTWDAGVIVKVAPAASEPAKPTGSAPAASQPAKPAGSLPITGATIGVGLLSAALALLVLGGVFQRLGRRKTL